MTISTGNPISISRNPERPVANNVTPWGRKRLKPSQAPTVGSVRDSTFISFSYRRRSGQRFSIEPENLADLPRYFVDLFGLVLFHVEDFLALGKFVSVGSRHESRMYDRYTSAIPAELPPTP